MGKIRPPRPKTGVRDRIGLEFQRWERKNRSSELAENCWRGCDCSKRQLIRDSLGRCDDDVKEVFVLTGHNFAEQGKQLFVGQRVAVRSGLHGYTAVRRPSSVHPTACATARPPMERMNWLIYDPGGDADQGVAHGTGEAGQALARKVGASGEGIAGRDYSSDPCRAG